MNTFAINTTYSPNNILEVNENRLKRSSYPFPPPLTIDLDKPSSPSSSNSSTTSVSSTSASPVPSSPSSSTSSTFSSSYTTTSSSSPSLKPENKSISEDEFYQDLQNHSSLLRIVLQKEFPLKIVDGQWYRLDLQVVNELGLSLGKERTKNAIMSLACELLELKDNINDNDDRKKKRKGKQRCIQDISEKDEKGYSLTWRALQFDAWEWDEEMQVPGFAGFEKCSKGGLEFKLQIKKHDLIKKHHHNHQQQQQSSSPRFFMRIIPTFESHQTIHALPLVVGPFSIMEEDKKTVDQYQQPIMNHHQYHQIQQQKYSNSKKLIHGSNVSNINHIKQQQKDDLWIMDLWYQEMYRAFKLNIQDRYFLVKEGWTLGTPGKMWDSALVLSDILVRRMVEHPTCFHRRHILDLSAG